ncbi:MAG: hypothetical protein H6923_06270 [Alphaproteobacteria bacterium]|nr:hypothetical protein [Alphaproteobacteria bacterium]
MLVAALGAAASSAAAAEPMRAADFVDSVGVNVHITYYDTPYKDLDRVVEALRYLGVRHVRDAGFKARGQEVERYVRLAEEAGVAFDIVLWPNAAFAQSFAALRDFHRSHPGALAAIEGPNEINNFKVAFEGKAGKEAGVAFQAHLHRLVKDDPAFAGIAVYNFTGPIVDAPADFANFHTYAKRGAQPRKAMVDDLNKIRKAAPDRPVVLTETGYPTLEGHPDGVDAATQAVFILNVLFDAARLGVARTYLYELFDERDDWKAPKGNNHYGLFDIAGTPKRSAGAVRNLLALFGDEGATATSFVPEVPPYTVSGLPPDGASLLFARSDGAYLLALWREPPIWSQAEHSALPVEAARVTVSFAGRRADARIFDPASNGDPIDTQAGVSEVPIAIADRPVILELVPVADNRQAE